MRMKKTGILAGITAACICIAQTVPAFGAGQDLVGFVPNEEKQEETQVKSYLTGENVPESIGRRRPVAVMMGNNSVGVPQSGTGRFLIPRLRSLSVFSLHASVIAAETAFIDPLLRESILTA